MKKLVLALTLMAGVAEAENVVVIPEITEGSVSREEGLAHWGRIYEVASHPRCSNCHVGASGVPMWSGPSYGEAGPHGMNVVAGESRIGAETLLCSTCHAQANSLLPHGPPGVADVWQLPPAEAEWFGKSSAYICAQIQDPERNGDRSIRDIAEHLDHDLILHWAWAPGPGREPAPYSLQETVNAIMAWGAAGAPCPEG